MILYPAIDLKNGNCVRLKQGDYDQETIYSNNPFQLLDQFQNAGAEWCHIIDLNGAQSAENNQLNLIAELINQSSLKIQTGGGIRTFEQAAQLFEAGAARIIIGSLAVTNPEEICRWIQYFGPEKIVLAFDVRLDTNQTPIVAVNGWQNNSSKSLFECLDYFSQNSLKHILCTDISRDGMLQGPNFQLYSQLITRYPNLHIQASGGIHTLSDLSQLSQLGAAGCIIGRALYENNFSLSEALSC
jgi:phosphoribosylformimino-5-aminoimidazole carboxamide ribotide isomerase